MPQNLRLAAAALISRLPMIGGPVRRGHRGRPSPTARTDFIRPMQVLAKKRTALIASNFKRTSSKILTRPAVLLDSVSSPRKTNTPNTSAAAQDVRSSTLGSQISSMTTIGFSFAGVPFLAAIPLPRRNWCRGAAMQKDLSIGSGTCRSGGDSEGCTLV